MNLEELKKAIAQLSASELETFSKWFEEFRAEAWDREIEADVKAGKLDFLIEQVDRDFDAGQCKPL